MIRLENTIVVMAATAAIGLVAASSVAGCDVELGPPVQDVGYEHDVGPATPPGTEGSEPPPDSLPSGEEKAGPTAGRSSGTAGRRSARSTRYG
jgi:hypothetical protein